MELSVIPERHYTVVEVEFQRGFSANETNGKRYEYRTRLDVKIGDAVVVEVNGSLKVVTVMSVKEPGETNFKGQLKWLVDKINVQDYVDRLAEEKAIEQEEADINRLAIEHRKIKAVKETFADHPELQERFNKLLERKRGL